MPKPTTTPVPERDPASMDAPMDGSFRTAIHPIGTPTPEQLSRINAQARRPMTADDVYVFDMEISNDLPDSFYTRMDADSTLRNYADDFAEGRALQNSHRTNELPIGKSFDARVEERGSRADPSNPSRTATVASFYVQRGIQLNSVANDHVIAGIDGGTIADGSVHFADGSYQCDVCGRDPYAGWGWFDDVDESDICMHFAGESYGEGASRKVATFTILDARAIEGSLVFDGSCPRAMVDKAQRMVEAGKLNKRQVASIEKTLHVRIRGATPKPRQRAANGRDRKTGETMDPKDFAALIASGLDAATRTKLGVAMVAKMGEDKVDRAFVTAVATELVRSTSLTADGASKVQEALDHIDNASESHDAAKEALMDLVEMGGMATADLPDAGGQTAEPDEGKGGAIEVGSTTGIGTDGSPLAGRSEGGKGKRDEAKGDLVAVATALAPLLVPVGDWDGTGTEPPERKSRTALRAELAKPELHDLRAFVERHDDGVRYRDNLIRDMHEWGVRAKGATYQRELFERMAPHLSTADLEEMVRQYEADAHARFAKADHGDIPDWAQGLARHGRQTTPSQPFGPTGPDGTRPPEASGEPVDAGFFTTIPLRSVGAR